MGRKNKVFDLRVGLSDASESMFRPSLATIKRSIGMEVEASDVGWGEEPARLFSIDTAMLVLGRHGSSLDEPDRQMLSDRLHEARRLVVAGRDDELEFIQNELESYLSHSWSFDCRSIWLSALDALLPSPFRAAETVVATALCVESPDSTDDLAEVLAQRLRARLSEATLMAAVPGTLLAPAWA